MENRDLASPALKSSVIVLDQPAVIQWNTDGLVMSWNPAAERLLGLPAEDAVGKNISELFASAGSFIDEQSRLRLFTECRAVDAISHTATKAGKHAFVSWSHAPVTGEGGNAICAVSTGRAVIAPDQHLSGLWLSEQGYRKIFEESPLGMIIVDANYRLVKANAMVSRVLGYTEQELLNLTFSDVTHPDDVSTYATHVRDLLTGRIPQFNVEKRYIAKNGDIIWGSVTASPIHDEKGNTAYVFILVEDITERKKPEEALRASEEQLRQSQKMEAVGRLAGGVAHEFNNIHCGILGHLDIILRREKLDKSLREKLQRVSAAARHASDITQRLLAFARKQPVLKQPARLDEIVADSLRLMQADFERNGVSVLTQLDAGAEFIMDKGQIAQALMNLIINARDAMLDSKRKELTVTTSLDKRRATLTVSDTGCGISRSDLPRVFEPFFTTKGPLGERPAKGGVTGTGLGLSVCYGIVKEHGGTISVESEEGRGATFAITFPRGGTRHGGRNAATQRKRKGPKKSGSKWTGRAGHSGMR